MILKKKAKREKLPHVGFFNKNLFEWPISIERYFLNFVLCLFTERNEMYSVNKKYVLVAVKRSNLGS